MQVSTHTANVRTAIAQMAQKELGFAPTATTVEIKGYKAVIETKENGLIAIAVEDFHQIFAEEMGRAMEEAGLGVA